MPRGSPPTDHDLKPDSSPADPELVSIQYEAKIAFLVVAVDHVLEETMQHTGRTILCWLRSTKRHVLPNKTIYSSCTKVKHKEVSPTLVVTFRLHLLSPPNARRRKLRCRLTGIRLKKAPADASDMEALGLE